MQDPSNVAKLGVGLTRSPTLAAPSTWKAFVLGYQHINRSSLTPLKWHLSWGAALSKGGGKPDLPPAMKKRVVHRFDEQGKAFYTQKMKAAKKILKPFYSHHAHGFLPFRRRESAVLVQQASIWKARRCGRSSISMNQDMSNAFGSTKRQVLSEQVPSLFLEADVHFGEQRHNWTAVEIPTSDKPLLLRNRNGSFMGDQVAVAGFLHSYEALTNTWNASHVFMMPPEAWAPSFTRPHLQTTAQRQTFHSRSTLMTPPSSSSRLKANRCQEPLMLPWNP